ncbi:DUF397 domain-containing protein [Streptomyces sp. NPDC101776]|uniref:DUF397 domain-containing protein n=1 Tax=Streptomyces sp. NPDC101776 TaxID=3366146 RepID=UPI00382CC0DC
MQWQKSSFSGIEGGNCLELAHHEGRILLRESDTPNMVVTAAPARLHALLLTIKTGQDPRRTP